MWATPARALEYDYDAPDACPNRAAFLSEVHSRLRYPEEYSTVERLQVSVRSNQGFEASFVLIEPGQPPVSRTLLAEGCLEAVKALALVAALALDARYREVQGIVDDPSASTSADASATVPPPEGATSALPEPAPAAPALPMQPQPVQPQPVQPQPIQPPPVLQAAPPVDVDVPPPDPHDDTSEPQVLAFAARLGAFAATGYAPDPSFGPSLAVAARSSRFALELEAFFGAENRAGNGEQSAEFWVLGGRLAPCARWSPSAGLWTKGCGVVELSGVHAQGVDGDGVARTAEDLAPYWALGGVVGVEAPLNHVLSLGVDLGLQFPLSRRRFEFVNANGALHEYPRVAARAQLSLCYSF